MMTKTIKAGLAAAIAASTVLAAPAFAADGVTRTVSVRYSDLDLSTQEGQAALERRLDRAAERVCGIDRRTSGPSMPSTDAMRCYRETVKDFEREIAARAQQQEQRG